MRDPLLAAELVRLGRALGVPAPRVEFLAHLPLADLRLLRERVSAALHDRHRPALGRMATASRLLPIGVLATIAARTMPPVLAAGIAAELAPERAAELATRLDHGYLAEVCVALDPRRAAVIVTHMPAALVLTVAAELVRRKDHLTLARFVGPAPEATVRAVLDGLTDADLLRTATFVESDADLARAIALLAPSRLAAAVSYGRSRGGVAAAATETLVRRLDLA
ncbi:MAG TPA: hypothetical protein VGD67_19235 [Pseudonocardiaceae bacterium]